MEGTARAAMFPSDPALPFPENRRGYYIGARAEQDVQQPRLKYPSLSPCRVFRLGSHTLEGNVI